MYLQVSVHVFNSDFTTFHRCDAAREPCFLFWPPHVSVCDFSCCCCRIYSNREWINQDVHIIIQSKWSYHFVAGYVCSISSFDRYRKRKSFRTSLCTKFAEPITFGNLGQSRGQTLYVPSTITSMILVFFLSTDHNNIRLGLCTCVRARSAS